LRRHGGPFENFRRLDTGRGRRSRQPNEGTSLVDLVLLIGRLTRSNDS
jgi:hypothetical protein